MTTKTFRKFRAGVESLERREVLSTAAASHVVSLRGSGTGSLIAVQAGQNGAAYSTVALLDGNATRLGHFNGLLTSNFAADNLTANGSAFLTGQNGDHLNVNYTGAYRKPGRNARAERGVFNFVVVGGTGEFAGASGGGRLDASVARATNALSFKIHGRLRE